MDINFRDNNIVIKNKLIYLLIYFYMINKWVKINEYIDNYWWLKEVIIDMKYKLRLFVVKFDIWLC